MADSEQNQAEPESKTQVVDVRRMRDLMCKLKDEQYLEPDEIDELDHLTNCCGFDSMIVNHMEVSVQEVDVQGGPDDGMKANHWGVCSAHPTLRDTMRIIFEHNVKQQSDGQATEGVGSEGA